MTTSVGNIHAEFRAFWHPVAWSDEVCGTPFAVVLLDEPLVLVRGSNGAARAFLDECPHRG
ncbi:MAG TPA: Rieske 2Fe-2S domain-containing protein, partial [Ilumatobacteraceae bacterium]